MRVLVVEDEATIAEALRKGLVQEGFVVDVARDGLSGSVLATSNPYDVVVLDIMLPELNGYDVLKRMRDARVWTPVLMLTAKDGEYDQTDAFDLGADDYLTKPFSFPVLVAHLRALQRRGGGERPVVLEAGDLHLDPVRHLVDRGGVEINVTAKEFTLLEFLMRNVDRALTKAAIMDGVWDTAYTGSDNIVEVYVGYLRKKLDAPFGVQQLVTVRGIGYRLLPEPQPAE